jgi:hypothetical protein
LLTILAMMALLVFAGSVIVLNRGQFGPLGRTESAALWGVLAGSLAALLLLSRSRSMWLALRKRLSAQLAGRWRWPSVAQEVTATEGDRWA